ncbi:MAG: site-specific DNA-methyltransferase [Angelakisella sp.]
MFIKIPFAWEKGCRNIELNKIYNEDCISGMEQIPDNSIDLIVTDPPYKITARGNGGNSGGMFQKKSVNNGKVFQTNDLEIEDWLPPLYRILKENSHCYIMTNNKNITHYLDVIDKSKFHYIKNLIWVKDNKIMGQTYMSQFEYIIMLRKGSHKRINNCGTSDVLQIPNKKMKNSEGKTIHDTEKPVKLMEILIENSSNKQSVIFDPFMGIGSTAVACKNINRNYLGFELDSLYYEMAIKRIAETKSQ